MVQTNVSMSDEEVECDECGYMYTLESGIFFREGGFRQRILVFIS